MTKVKRDLRVLGAQRLECFDSTAWTRYYSDLKFLGTHNFPRKYSSISHYLSESCVRKEKDETMESFEEVKLHGKRKQTKTELINP